MSYRVLFLALTWSGVIAAPMSATVLIPAEFREIVNGSEIIAFGRVVDATARTVSGRSRVETVVTLQVGTYLKGGPGETLEFIVPGGQIGRYRTIMVGAPTFEPGEEAVVFLVVRGQDRPSVFGLNQGVFPVQIDETTKRRMVVLPPVMGSALPELVVRGAVTRRPIPLETFGAQVQTVMAERDRR